jgi:predicted CXXCH cytochrome family protein
MPRRSLLVASSFILTLAAGFLFAACRTEPVALRDTPEIPGATFVGNQVCFDCHANISRSFPARPHARLHVAGLAMKGEAGCESCHGPGGEHVRVGGGRGRFIVNPGRDPAACFRCHQEIHAQFRLPHHHPLVEERMNCVQCHDPHGMDIFKTGGGPVFARLDQSCAACHREQTRPRVFTHAALREGCTACHQPHGSVNDKLLVARDNNLCLRCHAQRPDAAGNTFIGAVNHGLYSLSQGTCWSSGCHTAVHGSNVDPKFRY